MHCMSTLMQEQCNFCNALAFSRLITSQSFARHISNFLNKININSCKNFCRLWQIKPGEWLTTILRINHLCKCTGDVYHRKIDGQRVQNYPCTSSLHVRCFLQNAHDISIAHSGNFVRHCKTDTECKWRFHVEERGSAEMFARQPRGMWQIDTINRWTRLRLFEVWSKEIIIFPNYVTRVHLLQWTLRAY